MKSVQGCLDHAVNLIKSDALQHRLVLITGGGSGFGRQLAIMCTAAGANVVIGDLNVQGLEQTAILCQEMPGTCQYPLESTDVTSVSSSRKLFEFAQQAFGRPPDVVVVNAGVTEIGRVGEDVVQTNEQGRYPEKPVLTTLEVNLAGALLTASLAEESWLAYPDPTASRQLILLASMGGNTGIPGAPLYSASKHALIGYWSAVCARHRQLQTVPYNCHVVCPFFSLTGIIDKAIRFALSGLSLVNPDTVSATMLHIIRDIDLSKGPGQMFILPDHEDPLTLTDLEYGSLDTGFYNQLADTVIKREKQHEGPEYIKSRNADLFKALGLGSSPSGLQLALYGISAFGLAFVVIKAWTLSSPVLFLIQGFCFASMISSRTAAKPAKLGV